MGKKFYHLTLPYLYRHLDWVIPAEERFSRANFKLLQMLDRDNRGLNYVKGLTLSDFFQCSRGPETLYDYQEAALLVQFLPKNSLTKFEYVVARTTLFSRHSLTT